MKVLLATDGSEFSRAAVEKCCKLFGGSGSAEIHIVSAVAPVLPAVEPFAFSQQFVVEMQTVAEEQAKRIAAAAEKRLKECWPEGSGKISSSVVGGVPKQVIVQEAEERGADLIVMGSHGYGFWKSTLLGSVSDAVLHNAPCSVLIVRSSPDKAENE